MEANESDELYAFDLTAAVANHQADEISSLRETVRRLCDAITRVNTDWHSMRDIYAALEAAMAVAIEARESIP